VVGARMCVKNWSSGSKGKLKYSEREIGRGLNWE
jgi:hypothetical protein